MGPLNGLAAGTSGRSLERLLTRPSGPQWHWKDALLLESLLCRHRRPLTEYPAATHSRPPPQGRLRQCLESRRPRPPRRRLRREGVRKSAPLASRCRVGGFDEGTNGNINSEPFPPLPCHHRCYHKMTTPNTATIAQRGTRRAVPPPEDACRGWFMCVRERRYPQIRTACCGTPAKRMRGPMSMGWV